MALSNEQKERLSIAAAAAVKSESISGVPAEIILSQWALESGWGRFSPGNNCFGIKARPGGQRQLLETHEVFTREQLDRFLALGDGRVVLQDKGPTGRTGRNRYRVKDWFAEYPDLSECFTDHALLFRIPIYRQYLQSYHVNFDLETLIRGIAQKYATDPRYADSLLQIIRMSEVQHALRVARV